MTICIAAIATEDGKEIVVFLTDHMVTTPAGQFEHFTQLVLGLYKQ